jgi:hypothetical protein
LVNAGADMIVHWLDADDRKNDACKWWKYTRSDGELVGIVQIS